MMNPKGPVSNSVSECEWKLAQLLRRKHCVWTGNGTSGLYLAFKLCPDDRPKILLPALMCMQPMLAVHYAGKIPVFCDITEADANIDPDLVEGMLRRNPDIGAVVAVHLYGNAANISKLTGICKKYKVMLIEDAAQAFGGKFPDGSLLGSKGDYSVVSFGYSKILDLGDGGAFLTDDEFVAQKARDWESQIQVQPGKTDALHDDYKSLFYAILNLGRKDPRFYQMFDHFPGLFQSLFLYRSVDGVAEQISDVLDTLEDEVARRMRISDLYLRELKDIPTLKFFTQSGVPWRFTFRVDAARRDDLLSRVRNEGFDVSSWYPSITDWTPSGRLQGRDKFPVANRLEREVVNLWVDSNYDESKALSLTKKIKEILLP